MSHTGLPPLPPRRTLVQSICLLVAVPLVVFLPSLRNAFVEWDDGSLIAENPIVQTVTSRAIGAAFTTYDPELYIPLTSLSYQFDSVVGGLSPAFVHAHNIAQHVLNVVLVAWLVYLLSASGWMALFCGLLFAVHPLQVETVVWASARKDLLSTSFFLLSVIGYLYARARETESKWRWLSVGAFALALLSKATVITLPLFLLLIDARDGKLNGRKALEKWPYAALAGVFAVIAVLGKKAFVAALSPVALVLIAAKGIVFYMQKFLWPAGLSLLYYTDPVTLLSPGLLLTLAAAAWYAGRKWHRDIFFTWLFFLLALAPTFPAYRKGEHLGDISFASDRYFYLAGIGLVVLAGMVFLALLRCRFRPAIAASGIIVCVLAALSIRQSAVWRDTDALFFNVLALYPNSATAHLNVGNHYQRLGDMDRALQEYDASLRLRPLSLTYFNIARAYLSMRRYGDAVDASQKALALESASVPALLRLSALADAAQNKQAAAAYIAQIPVGTTPLRPSESACGLRTWNERKERNGKTGGPLLCRPKKWQTNE